MILNDVAESAEQFGSIDSVETIEMLGDYASEKAVLINDEKIHFGGGGSMGTFDVDDFLWILEELEENYEPGGEHLDHGEFGLRRQGNGEGIDIYVQMDEDFTADYGYRTLVNHQTIRDIKDRFRL